VSRDSLPVKILYGIAGLLFWLIFLAYFWPVAIILLFVYLWSFVPRIENEKTRVLLKLVFVFSAIATVTAINLIGKHYGINLVMDVDDGCFHSRFCY
jgi:hypothetical protein